MDPLRLIVSNDSNWVEAIKQVEQLQNELRFYRGRVHELAEQQFNAGWHKGFNTGAFVGCVAGMWITVAFAFVWSVA